MSCATVYSTADASALHVRMADQAMCVGPPESGASYLRADAVLEAARKMECDAVHPGYGFLSENGAFAQAVMDAGLVWIGPSPEAIHAMGNKTAARQRMAAAHVPIVPGTTEPVEDAAEAERIARDIGMPVMIKAAAGGGGKGMRAVEHVDDLSNALASARSEAASAFGDPSVYVEKRIDKPRHIEIQIVADTHGNVLHLFERDCSIQRRHQKVFEEAPCPVLPEPVRQAMARAAIDAAKAVQYVGAGTIEFLYDASSEAFYFLEMNTRLQVEHPITELITGIDLVKAQLLVASGAPLPWTQDDIAVNGHAVECRVYAEDPSNGFRPAPGAVVGYREPSGGWVRVDSGVVAGAEIPMHYDPMVAKLVVWGRDRDDALARASRAIDDYRIVGVPTSLPFFKALFSNDSFTAGTYDTGFITPQWLAEHVQPGEPSEALLATLAIARFEQDRNQAVQQGAPAASHWAARARQEGLSGGER